MLAARFIRELGPYEWITVLLLIPSIYDIALDDPTKGQREYPLTQKIQNRVANHTVVLAAEVKIMMILCLGQVSAKCYEKWDCADQKTSICHDVNEHHLVVGQIVCMLLQLVPDSEHRNHQEDK